MLTKKITFLTIFIIIGTIIFLYLLKKYYYSEKLYAELTTKEKLINYVENLDNYESYNIFLENIKKIADPGTLQITDFVEREVLDATIYISTVPDIQINIYAENIQGIKKSKYWNDDLQVFSIDIYEINPFNKNAEGIELVSWLRKKVTKKSRSSLLPNK